MERATFKQLDDVAAEVATLLGKRVRVDHAFRRVYLGGTDQGGGEQVSPTGVTVTELYHWMTAWQTGVRMALQPKVETSTDMGRFVEDTAQTARRQGLNVLVVAEQDGRFLHRLVVESDSGHVIAAFSRMRDKVRENTNAV